MGHFGSGRQGLANTTTDDSLYVAGANGGIAGLSARNCYYHVYYVCTNRDNELRWPKPPVSIEVHTEWTRDGKNGKRIRF